MIALNFNPFPTIETKNLLLRQINTSDIDNFYELRSNKIAMQYIDRPKPKNREDIISLYNLMENNLENNTDINWVIQYKDNPEMLGYIGFYRIDAANHRSEIGYLLHPNHFRKGIMTEAIEDVISIGFSNFNFNSITANINPANEASKAIATKMGFVQEAYFREDYYFDGKFLDSAIYCLLKSDWEKIKSTK